ncbi:MAG TPA: glycoside hydrolase family 3 N-terminal domain-containing protein [Pseudomonas sp.]|uniref:glycoside hydrolase family 3 N-terminal domain-containing protein n=1 Tax=Pseudomonas sp. TaxID=306 RepID=UPI002ED9F061
MFEACMDTPLEYKIGQMFIVGFSGGAMSDELRSYLVDYNVGGVILFNKAFGEKESNIHNPQQVNTLISDIKSVSPMLPFISVDQEGGNVARLNPDNGFPATPSHQALAQLSASCQYREAKTISTMLVDSGFNFNFAPVVDVNVNPLNPIIAGKERSFSADPAVVADCANIYMTAARDSGIISSIKHFPGHGSSIGDSHLGFVDITDTYKEHELSPFRTLIANGYSDTVMIAHVFNRNVDPIYPASMSKSFISDLLKDELGFKGVAISDDLGMKALANHWSTEQILVNAVNAGTDLLIYSNNLGATYDRDYVKSAIDIVKRNVENGTIAQSRIDDAYDRIMDLKDKLIR